MEDTAVPEGHPRLSSENKGSLVIRAMRSVRSIARISESSQQPGADSNTQVPSVNLDSKAVPEKTQSVREKIKKPSIATRRPSESTSSWEVGALSSPERESRPSVLVPSSGRRRLVVRRAPSSEKRDSGNTSSGSLEAKAIPRPPQSRPVPSLVEKTSDESLEGPPLTLIVRPVVNKRHSILSVISTDDASGVDSPTSLEKQNRRSSTGSNIRWDADAMSQMAQKVREERKQLKARRERERAQSSQSPSPREAKRDRSLARRRTPLSEVFDLSSCVEDSLASVDPIVAATRALIEATPSNYVEDIPQARPRNKPASSKARPVGMVALDTDQDDGECEECSHVQCLISSH